MSLNLYVGFILVSELRIEVFGTTNDLFVAFEFFLEKTNILNTTNFFGVGCLTNTLCVCQNYVRALD